MYIYIYICTALFRLGPLGGPVRGAAFAASRDLERMCASGRGSWWWCRVRKLSDKKQWTCYAFHNRCLTLRCCSEHMFETTGSFGIDIATQNTHV